jgi:hypothetical protein
MTFAMKASFSSPALIVTTYREPLRNIGTSNGGASGMGEIDRQANTARGVEYWSSPKCLTHFGFIFMNHNRNAPSTLSARTRKKSKESSGIVHSSSSAMIRRKESALCAQWVHL